MLKGDKEDVPESINYRANQKNKVKREVVAATAQRLNDSSHAAIREMRSARLSAVHTQANNAKEPKSQSAREMRLARLKHSTSSTSAPEIQHKSLKKAVRVEKPPEPKDQEQVTSSIREMRLAQGKAPVAKSYTASTPVLRVPKTSVPSQKPIAQSVRPKSVPIRTAPKQVKVKEEKVKEVEEEEGEKRGCTFIVDDMAGGCNGLPQAPDMGGCNAALVAKKDDLTGGCNAPDNRKMPEDVGCDFSMLQELSAFLGCGEEAPGADLVSRGSSEDSATMYVKKYGYDS